MGFEGLGDLITRLANDENIDVNTVFNVIFDNGLKVPNGLNKDQLMMSVKRLSACFDLNGDGTYTPADLEYLKRMDMVVILKIANGASYTVQFLRDLAKIDIDRQTFIDLTFRLIVYATLLPLADHCAEFKVWINQGQNKELLLQALNTLHNMIESSDAIANAVDSILKAVKKRCPCFSAPNDPQDVQMKINAELSQVTTVNQLHTTQQTIERLTSRLNALENKN